MVDKRWPIAQSGGNFGISANMQELLCYLGQERVFEDASRILKKLTGVDVNAKQIERVCHYYGEALETYTTSDKYQSPLYAEIARQSPVKDADKKYYILVDGSMVFTREEQWKEVKLGRIFRSDKRVDRVGVNRNMITSSQYVAHLGNHNEFWDKMEVHIEAIPKKRRVFLCDGASWIWNRVEDSHGESIQIVDFFHAKEHLSILVSPVFKNKEEQKKKWLSEQEQLLFEDNIEEIKNELKRLMKIHPSLKSSINREINYFSKHAHRMQYGTFRKSGLLIGSGPIESAHRKVVQQRLKLSGQRWTMTGLQTIVTLRAAYLSGEWDKVFSLIKNSR